MAYEYEPYTLQNVLQYAGKYYVCGTGRQTPVKDKTANDNYYLLTMAAVAQELKRRKAEKCVSVVTVVWEYIGELVFNLLILVGAVKAADRILKEMMGL